MTPDELREAVARTMSDAAREHRSRDDEHQDTVSVWECCTDAALKAIREALPEEWEEDGKYSAAMRNQMIRDFRTLLGEGR